MTSEERSIDVGHVLDKYELVERVGQGGMAVVYRGRDRELGREVAVKVLHHHLANYQEARDRFEREARAVAKLRHENILEIFDYSGTGLTGATFIVTEFIDGQTLKQFITAHPIAFPEIGAMIVAQIGRALAHAHASGVLHRDVKPENVMIRRDGVIKLTDFGISHMVDLERLTITGQLLGSPAYMAPEHVEGRPIDYRTDVFAAGIVLYQLTVGRLPFEGKNPHEVLKRIAECTFISARKANAQIGNHLGRILDRAMARDPADRYAAMSEMVLALEAYLASCGLDHPAAELARYFQAPAAYETALRARLVDHLVRRGKAQLGADHPAALDALDRVLTLDPGNAEVLAALDQVTWRRRSVRIVAATATIAAIAAGVIAVQHTRRVSLVFPDVPALLPYEGARHRVALDDPPPPPRSEEIEDTGDPEVAGERAASSAAPPTRRVATESDAPAQAVLVVSPADSEVSIDGGPWQRAPQRLTIAIANETVRVTVRNDACCESQSRTLTRNDAGTQVTISLDFLAAQVIPRCAVAGVEVRVDGKLARLDSAASIPFGATTRTQRSVVVEFLGDRIDRHVVIVHPAVQQEVTCALP